MNLLKKCTAEFIGAFAIVFAGCGAIIAAQISPDAVTHVGIAAVFGLVVMVMIYAVGHISGAHFNPAVTVAFSLSRHFPANEILPYISAQCLGAIAGSGLHLLLLNPTVERLGLSSFNLGVTQPVDGAYWTAFGMEVVLTFFLMFVIISVATDYRAVGEMAGLAIGSTVALDALFGGPISGASMNPARSLGPALMSGDWIHFSAYVFGPVLGAILGAGMYNFIRCETRERKNAQGCC